MKRKRPRNTTEDGKEHPRSVSNEYYFEIHGKRVRVCRATLLATLNETDSFVRKVAAKKAKTVSGIPPDDMRGHHVPPHKLKDETETAVWHHNMMYPSYQSHYCRGKTDARFLPSNLNITKMHQQYLANPAYPPVSYATYHRVFSLSNRKFKQPPSDSCTKCDEFKISSQVMTGDQLDEVLRQRDEHFERAELAYDLKREEKLRCCNDYSKVLDFRPGAVFRNSQAVVWNGVLPAPVLHLQPHGQGYEDRTDVLLYVA